MICSSVIPPYNCLAAHLVRPLLVFICTQAGAELTWLVCRSSVLNAEELGRNGGLQVLGGLVQRWLDTPAARELLDAGERLCVCVID